MTIPLTGDTFIEQVRRATRIPDGNSAFSDAEILRTADEEYENKIMPLLEGAFRAHHARELDVPIVTGQREYKIPTRSRLSGVRALALVDQSGAETPMVERDIGQNVWKTGQTVTYYWIGDGIRFSCDPPANYTLRWFYILRPGYFSKVGERSASITNISGADVTIDAVPVDIGLQTNDTVDTIVGHEPYLFGDIDVPIQSILGSVLTFASPLEFAAVGDLLGESQYTPVFQGPHEAYTLLMKATSARVLDTLGYQDSHRRMVVDYVEDEKRFRLRIKARNQDSQPKVVNRSSALRFRRGRRGSY